MNSYRVDFTYTACIQGYRTYEAESPDDAAAQAEQDLRDDPPFDELDTAEVKVTIDFVEEWS